MIASSIALLMAQAVTPSERPASEVFAENRAAIDLWGDPSLRDLYRPYFSCLSDFVLHDPRSDLRDDATVVAVSFAANAHCALVRASGTQAADAYLARLRPDFSGDQRTDTLVRYRRQMGFAALLKAYDGAGRASAIQQYLARFGKAARTRDMAAPLEVK